mmetsp:Transcript_90080/g.124352  ORF Transcript_90080/g.124352 Transcript_90080/m.124352 type:complete len:119 (-) Transcript_90080:84-440(-)
MAFLAGVDVAWLYAAVLGGFGVAGAIISWRRPMWVIRFGTSFIGAYCFVRGLSYWIGGFPSESEIWNSMMNDDVADISYTWAFYGYLAAIVVIGIGSWVFQAKHDEVHEDLEDFYKEV